MRESAVPRLTDLPALRNGVTKQIDVGKVTFLNHENEPVSRYFLNVASFGLSYRD